MSIYNYSLLPTFSNNYINDNNTHNNTSKKYDIERALPFLIIGSFGVILNALTIIVLGSSSVVRKKILNTLLIHQSIIDFVSSVALLGTAHLSLDDQHGLEGTIADVHCIFLAGKMIYWTPVLVSTLHLIWINVERYISIIFPLFHQLYITRKTVIKMAPFIWAFGIFTNALLNTAYRSIDGMCGLHPGKSLYHRFYVMTIIQFHLDFFLPLIIFIVLNGHIYFKLKSQISNMSGTVKDDGHGSNRDRNLEKAKRSIFQLMVIMSFCYCVCFGFNTVYLSLWMAGFVTDLTGNFNGHMHML